MKQKYLLFFIAAGLSFTQALSQNCTSLGCAANYGSQTVVTTISSVNPANCYPVFYKQVYWQFFYAPAAGVFTQTYTPTSTGDPLDLDYVIFDIGLSGPGSITCPVNTSGYTEILCMSNSTPGIATGPGVDAIFNTVANHFYAIAIYAYQDSDPTYTFDIGNPQIDGVDLDALNCPGVLPVKLSSFDARLNSCKVNLEWVAETESKLKDYQVEYSNNGSIFQTIGTLSPGMGINKKYVYTHSNPAQGRIFYRLKMKDLDGRIEYSKTIALNLDCSGNSVLLYPNPVTDKLNVNISNAGHEQTVANLFDNSGKLVYSGSLRNGTNTIDMTGFSRGIYILRLKNNEGIQNLKIVR